MTNHDETIKYVVDGISVVTMVAAMVEILPSVAALFTIAWTGIRIYETATVQRLLGREPGNASEE